MYCQLYVCGFDLYPLPVQDSLNFNACPSWPFKNTRSLFALCNVNKLIFQNMILLKFLRFIEWYSQWFLYSDIVLVYLMLFVNPFLEYWTLNNCNIKITTQLRKVGTTWTPYSTMQWFRLWRAGGSSAYK